MELLCKGSRRHLQQRELQVLVLLLASVLAVQGVRLQVVENSPLGYIVGEVDEVTGSNTDYR